MAVSLLMVANTFMRSYKIGIGIFGVITLSVVGIFAFGSKAQAAQCGPGSTPNKDVCACGDTVMGNYTLTGDLSCDVITTNGGLVVGAHDIVIDGGGYTISNATKALTSGIKDTGGYRVTIQNIIISSFGRGIYMQNVSAGTITNVTTTNNINGIYLITVTNVNINNNYSSSNGASGIIFLSNSNSNILTGNTFVDNIIGITISSGGSNVFTNSTLTNNTTNIKFGTDSTNSFDTSNTIDGKKVYFLANQNGTAENYLQYTGDDIGVFVAFNCSYLNVTNATLATGNYYSIYLNNVTTSTFSGLVIANSNYQNIYLANSNYVTFSNNIIHSTYAPTIVSVGINIDATSHHITLDNNKIYDNGGGPNIKVSGNTNTITSNEIYNNSIGVNIDAGSISNNILSNSFYNNNYALNIDSTGANTIDSNKIFNNNQDFSGGRTGVVITNNELFHNSTSTLFGYTDITRKLDVGTTISTLNFKMVNVDGSACSDCTYSVATDPNEDVTVTKVGNNLAIIFTPAKAGTYALNVKFTDAGGNQVRRKFNFTVTPVGESATATTTRYYLRGGAFQNTNHHGQPQPIGVDNNDAHSMLFTLPTTTETISCTAWVQSSPDSLPDYSSAMATLDSINIKTWYIVGTNANLWTGIQERAEYNYNVDNSLSIDTADTYTLSDWTISNLNYEVDYPRNWYWYAVKMAGLSAKWQTTPDQLSYVDFTYTYSPYPSVHTNSNEKVLVMAATKTNTDNYSVVLENSIFTATTTNLTLDNSAKPYSGYTSTIGMDGTTTVTSPSIGTNASTTLTLLPVNLVVRPASASVDIDITTWNTSDPYYKKWTETSLVSQNVVHTIGNLSPNTQYVISYTKDGGHKTTLTTIESNSSGEITFTYDQGYSMVTFEVETYSAPVSSSGGGAPLPIGNTGNSSGFINNTGGTIASVLPNGGEARVNIPAGTGLSGARILITPYTSPIAQLPSIGIIVAGLTFNISASNGVFPIHTLSVHIPITVTYNPVQIATAGVNENTLALYRYNETTHSWLSLDSQVNTFTHTITAYTDHFSLFAVFSTVGVSTPKPVNLLLKVNGDARVYIVTNGYRRHIPSEAAFNSYGYRWTDILTVEQTQLDVYPEVNLISNCIITRELKFGSLGNDVRCLQKILTTLGYFKYYKATGYYGSVTTKAVMAFQKARGLAQTGIADTKVRAELGR